MPIAEPPDVLLRTNVPVKDQLRTNLPAVAILLILLSVPLYRTGMLEDAFTAGKIFLIQILSAFGVIGALIRPKGITRAIALSGMFFLAFIGWRMVTAYQAQATTLAVIQGGFLVGILATFLLAATCINTSKLASAVLNTGAIAATATAVWTLYDDTTRGGGIIVARLPDWRGYLTAGLGNSGHIAGFCGMFLPWITLRYFMASSKSRFMWWLALLLIGATLTITWSVGSIGATLVGLFWLLLLVIRRKNFRQIFRPLPALGLLAALIMVSSFYLLPHPWHPHGQSLLTEAFSSERWHEGWPTRIAIWATSWSMIENAPWLGYGLGNFTYGYVEQIVPLLHSDPTLFPYAGRFTNDAHNDLLQIWSESGIVAPILYLGFFLTLLIKIWGAGRRVENGPLHTADFIAPAASAGVVVFFFDGMMSFPMSLPAHFAAMAILAGLTQSQSPRLSSAPRRHILFFIIAALLLPYFIYRQSQRITAEYHQKDARRRAESGFNMQNISTWSLIEQQFTQGLFAPPNADGSRPALSVVSEMAGYRLAGARTAFEKAVAADAGYSNASSRLASLYLWTGEYDKAVQTYQQCLNNLQTGEIRRGYGIAAYLSGQPELARKQWELWQQRVPSDQPQAAQYLALLD